MTRIMLLLLALAAKVMGETAFHEAWQGGLRHAGGLAAWGCRHAWQSGGAGGLGEHSGLPAGVLSLVEGDGSLWAVLASGELRRLSPASAPGIWQQSRSLLAAIQAGPGRAWLLDEDRICLVRLPAAGSPEVLRRLRTPTGGPPFELKVDGRDSWLRAGPGLYRLDGGGTERLGRLPGSWRDWAPWRGRLLGLDGAGTVAWLDQDLSGSIQDPDAPRCLGRDRRWSALRRTSGCLWLREEDGPWWRWSELDTAPEPLPFTDPGIEGRVWLPVNDDLALAQSGEERAWWSADGGWHATQVLQRPPVISDRLVRWSALWRLRPDGLLERRNAGPWRTLGAHPGATRLLRAGGGPLVLAPEGLSAYSEEGALIGGWSGEGAGEACTLEDHLLLAGGDRLRVFWTAEEDPWLLAELALPGAGKLSASAPWSAVAAEGRVWLVDLSLPWLPQVRDERALPPGTLDFLMVEDRLLLFREDGLEAWSCQGGVWEPVVTPLPSLGAANACRRGADRVLALESDGRLRQLRLRENLPLEVEWSLDLPISGRMEVARDSLRVVGAVGWLDWPLPALSDEGEGAGMATASSPLVDLKAEPPALETRRLGKRLSVTWRMGELDARRLRLHDLLGRRLREWSVGNGAALLDLAGLPAGCYVLEPLGADGGSLGARTLSWRP